MRLIVKARIFVLIALVLLAIGCVENTTTTTDPSIYVTPSEPYVEPAPAPPLEMCKWDWEFSTQKYIGKYNDAPNGYTYAVVTVYLKNEADEAISTNPWNWGLIANGIEYNHDSSTYNDIVNHRTVDVHKDGEFTTKFVYLVTDDVEQASLYYSGYDAPLMERIDYFQSLKEKSRKLAEEEKSRKLTEEEEKKELVLSELNDAGYNVDSIEISMELLYHYDKSADREMLIFNIPDVESAKNIVEMSQIASKYYNPYGYMTYAPKKVDSNLQQSYWISKNDFNAYKNNYMELDKITVYSPNKQSKRMMIFLKMFD